MKLENFPKRTWHYILNPTAYEIHCDKCHGHNIEWSEYVGLIWCYDCKVDTRGTEGVFGGPIPQALSEMLGMVFHIYDMKENKIVKFERSDSPDSEWNKVVSRDPSYYELIKDGEDKHE